MQDKWIIRCADKPIQIEVEDLDSFVACLQERVDLILLDNQRPETIAEWIRTAGERVPGPWHSVLEASGGITDRDLASYARCGVTRVSMGALTHSVEALDFSLHVEWVDTDQP